MYLVDHLNCILVETSHRIWADISLKLWSSNCRPWRNIKTLSYQYMKSQCEDKTIVRSSYLRNRNSYAGDVTSLYWIDPLSVLRLCVLGICMCHLDPTIIPGSPTGEEAIITLKSDPNDRQFADDIFKCICFERKLVYCVSNILNIQLTTSYIYLLCRQAFSMKFLSYANNIQNKTWPTLDW